MKRHRNAPDYALPGSQRAARLRAQDEKKNQWPAMVAAAVERKGQEAKSFDPTGIKHPRTYTIRRTVKGRFGKRATVDVVTALTPHAKRVLAKRRAARRVAHESRRRNHA